MKVIRSYPNRIEAELGRMALESAGMPSVVAGVEASMEGGSAGIQLLVADEFVEAALQMFEDLDNP